MAWLSPWMLLGLGALAVPVLVHLVTRESRRARPFPSLMFLERVPFRARRRKRLRDPLLLALRALAMAALVLAFAGPLADPPGSQVDAPGDHDTVLLMDGSASMSVPGRWAEALRVTRAAADAAIAGGRVGLVVFDDQARVLLPLTRDADALQRTLGRLRPGPGGTRFADALDAAGALLAHGGAATRSIVLVSDLQQSALARGGILSLPGDIVLRVQAIATPVGANLALLDVAVASGDDGDGVREALQVTLANTGDAPATDRPLTLRVNGLLADGTRTLSLAAGEARRVRVPVVLAADGPTRVVLQVPADAVSADDTLHAVLAPRRPVRVALVLDPARRRHPGLFLEQALRIARSPRVVVTRMDVASLSRQTLAEQDVVLLEDVDLGQGSRERAVAAFVDAGGGVLVIAGPRRAGSWEAAGDGLVPGAPRGLIRAADRRLLPDSSGHALWVLAGAGPRELLAHAGVNIYMGLAPGPGDRVLARLEDGTALIIERTRGAGRVMVLGTTANPRWSTLALEPGFVPLVQSMVTLLAGRAPPPMAVLAGQVVDLADHLGQLGPDSGWRAYLSGGGKVVLERPQGAVAGPAPDGAVFRTRLPGLYEAHRADGEGGPLPVAVNLDPAESRLEGVPPERFAALVQRRAVLAADRPPADAVADSESAQSWVSGLLLLAALAFVAESLLAAAMARRPVT